MCGGGRCIRSVGKQVSQCIRALFREVDVLLRAIGMVITSHSLLPLPVSSHRDTSVGCSDMGPLPSPTL